MSQIFNTSLNVKGDILVDGTISKLNGTNLQFLKADGSVDNSSYQTIGDTHYVGTTAIANNRASAVQTLTGISIDGNSVTSNSLVGYTEVTEGNWSSLYDEAGSLRLLSVMGIPTASTGMDSIYGTVLHIGGYTIHDKTQLIFNGENGSIQYRKSWSPNTPWTSIRTLWDSANFTNLNQLTTRDYSDLQNKPTTLSGYGITDAIVTGTLISGYIPKATGANSLGNSSIYDNGTNVLVGTVVDDGVNQLQVNGSAKFASSVASQGLTYGKAINYTGDLNDLTEAGFYDGYELINAPTNGWFHYSVQRHANDDNWVVQTATGFGSLFFTTGTYTRTKSNGSWQPWRRIWDDGNFSPDDKVDKVAGKSLISDSEITRLATVTNQDISGKFDKTGGTISGDTSVTGTVTASGGFFNSDLRLKNIIKRDGDVAYFKWKDNRDEQIHIGYIAQEVQVKNNEQINKNEEGFLSVNYIEILVEKVRELEKQIEILKSK